MSDNHLYQLAKRGKWICPSCGKKTFVCYVDANGNVLNEEVGKCDRADKCAYHYPPREYFADNNIVFEAKQQRRQRTTPKPQLKPSYIDSEIFKQSVTATRSHRNNLIDYLNGVFGIDLTNQMVADYYIGTSNHWYGSTVFWQVDRFGHVRGGKIMQYNPTTGKRVKEPSSRITWVHTAMKMADYNLSQCLFGEHLLRLDPNMTVAIVESEKTAIIASAIFGDCIMVACGGLGNLNAKMCEPLRGRDVVLFPDNGCFEKWATKGKKLKYLFRRLRIADIMEREANCAGDDIGDLIVAHYQEWCSNLDYCAPDGSISLDLGLHEL